MSTNRLHFGEGAAKLKTYRAVLIVRDGLNSVYCPAHPTCRFKG